MSDPVRPLIWIGSAELAGLAAMLVTVLISGVAAGDSVGLVASGAVVYASFLAGLGAVVLGLRRRSRFARSPFIVAQLFGLVAAWLFLASDQPGISAVGAVLGVASLVGAGLALRPVTLTALN